MKVSIGKNTLGGGKKMMTRLNNYNRSTHDLSHICRTTMAVGTLVPTLKHLVLPGDTFPIQTRCHSLTHPTIGPLFGSFKQQNDFFFCPIRLYNAMLHNNALNIGLDMKKVKFPVIKFATTLWNWNDRMNGSAGTLADIINPSSLLSYLGYKNLKKDQGNTPGNETWNFTTVAMYFDIFKNYYANKQESDFYTIGANGHYLYKNSLTNLKEANYAITVSTLTEGKHTLNNNALKNEKDYRLNIGTPAANQSFSLVIVVSPSNKINANIGESLLSIDISRDIETTESGELSGNLNKKIYGTIDSLIEKGVLRNLPASVINNGNTNYKYYQIANFGFSYNNIIKYQAVYVVNTPAELIDENLLYNQYKLEDIDNMRENILAAGRNQYQFTEKFITDIVEPLTADPESGTKQKPACSQPMVGLALKTYQSDINTNWVNTEWIDGDTGINAITAIDTSSGSFTLDTLNLAKKVYTMLNRIAVSDGSYNAWIQTVYTSGGLNHIETPLYLGGSSLEIEFQEVVNNSGTEDQPLGTLAGRGMATNHKGGNIVFKADEPGYIFCITSITPRVDYFQGNEWDNYLMTLDDLHKPQLDGIGFQDRLYRSVNANTPYAMAGKSIGKQPAWVEYMTNVNKTYGNFALIENEGWMCLNRIFGDISTYTTYVFPHLYNNIFADTDITAQNFWIQIAFNTNPRRVMSAKVIPNI